MLQRRATSRAAFLSAEGARVILYLSLLSGKRQRNFLIIYYSAKLALIYYKGHYCCLVTRDL